MRSNILNYINKLQSYKTAIKNLHWSSKRMSEHKLLDDIADSVAENQDEIKFNIKPHKIFVFDGETEERIYSEKEN